MILEVKVVPNAKQTKWVLETSGQLKCYIKSAPEKNKANNELITLLAKLLAIPLTHVRIISGATARKKRVNIKGDISYEQVLQACGLASQQNFVRNSYTKKVEE